MRRFNVRKFFIFAFLSPFRRDSQLRRLFFCCCMSCYWWNSISRILLHLVRRLNGFVNEIPVVPYREHLVLYSFLKDGAEKVPIEMSWISGTSLHCIPSEPRQWRLARCVENQNHKPDDDEVTTTMSLKSWFNVSNVCHRVGLREDLSTNRWRDLFDSHSVIT